MSSKVGLIWSFIKVFFRSPVSFIKKINVKNVSTLRKALGNNEKNVEIVQNLEALVHQEQVFQDAEPSTKDEKVEFFSKKNNTKKKNFTLQQSLREKGKKNSKGSTLFNPNYYIKQLKEKGIYKDGVDYGYKHFLEVGYKYSVSPIYYFDYEYYSRLAKLDKSTNAYLHYQKNGDKLHLSPHPLINLDYIINRGIITKYAGDTMLDKIYSYYSKKHEHYESPHPLFATEWYDMYRNKRQGNPFVNFLASCKKESGHPLTFEEVYYETVKPKENYLVSISTSLFFAKKVRENPKVSIVILNWNKSIMTLQCVATIINNTVEKSYEIIVIDNGSASEDFTNLHMMLKSCCNVIRLETNRFFGEANNIAVEEARGEFVVFLNNDAFVHKYWLKNLFEQYYKRPNTGGVGSLLLFPDGRVQESGGEINLKGKIIQENKEKYFEDLNVLLPKKTAYKSAASFLMKKELYYRVGGFDYIYEPAYFEDTDLCMKITALGYDIYSCPSSRVTHIENLTSKSKGIGFNMMDKVKINRKKFYTRWDCYLESNGKNNIVNRNHNIRPYEGKRSNTKAAIVYTPYALNAGGGERYILSIACALVKEGSFNVYLCTPNRYSIIRLQNLATDLNLDISSIIRLIPITYSSVSQIKEPVEYTVVMGNELYPSIPALGKYNYYHCQFPFPNYNPDFYVKTNKYLSAYEAVIVNSEYTKKNYLLKLNEPKKVNVLSPPVYIPSDININQVIKNKKNIILTVGRFFVGGHEKRHDILIEAFKELYDKENFKEEFEFHLVGGTYTDKIHQDYIHRLEKMAIGYPIFFHYDASNIKLKSLYENASIYWHATGFGVNPVFAPEKMEHFGISVVESLSYGCIPFFYNGGGPKEILKNHVKQLGYVSVKDLVAKTVKIVRNEKDAVLRKQLSNLANQYSDYCFLEKALLFFKPVQQIAKKEEGEMF